VKILAEIRPGSEDGPRIGALRRSDLEAFTGLVERLGDAGAVLVTGTEHAAAAVAVGIATAAAARGAHVALLECDPVEPVLAGALGIAERPGLREYLLGESEAAEVLQPLVLAGPGAGGATEPLVCVVAGGQLDGSPLLASERFRQAMAGLRASYGLVVIAGPPLERGFARLHEVARLADTTVACAGRAELRGASFRRLRRALRRLPGRFSGFVAFD
jgi:Mrp family chromosome partitioning ATPase